MALNRDKHSRRKTHKNDMVISTFSQDTSIQWNKHVWSTIVDAWSRIVLENDALEKIAEIPRMIAKLRVEQSECESKYLDGIKTYSRKIEASLELIGLYHLARSAEIVSRILTDENCDCIELRAELDMHFNKTLGVCNDAPLVEMEFLTRLLRVNVEMMFEQNGRGGRHEQNISQALYQKIGGRS